MKRLLPLIAVMIAACATISSSLAGSVGLGWQAPTTNTDNSVISGTLSYNIYQVASSTATSGGTKVASGITAGVYQITNLTDATTVCYAVTAVETYTATQVPPSGATEESGYSNAVCAALPPGVPSTPLMLTITVGTTAKAGKVHRITVR
ncbi:MAG: hypothetical protein KGL39_24600 [Patescibacteria group bacterium]|nr:hypothetical protein [Patescibacteria group bacterium]